MDQPNHSFFVSDARVDDQPFADGAPAESY